MAILDLETQLTFYGSYHSHSTNILIHIIFVPILMFGLFSYGTLLPLPFLAPVTTLLGLPEYLANFSTLTALVYAALYTLMEPLAGGLAAPLVVGQSLLGAWVKEKVGSESLVYWVTVSQVLAWAAQFVGHGVFEKRAPALKDNVVQALFLAPFFVWVEVLWRCGYRPELRERIEGLVEKEKERVRAKWEKEAKREGKKEL